MAKPLMAKATAVWLVDNTTISFKQIADFVGMHELEVQGIADGDVAAGEVRGRSFGASFVPRQPGLHQPTRGAAFAASLLDAHASGVAPAGAADIPELDAAASSGFDLITVLLLLALLLLAAEWVLFRTSRIP